jgi:quercetin dioxygenase-like cupin family protein
MKRAAFIVSAVLVLAFATSATAQMEATIVAPDDVKFTDIKDSPGWQIAPLVGDMTKPGYFIVRIKMAPNVTLAPHTHPIDENLTVISGELSVGDGTNFDKSKGKLLRAGTYYFMPAGHAHFGWAGPNGAITQIEGMGPFGITMLTK